MLPLGRGVRILKQDANGLIAFYKPAGIFSHSSEIEPHRPSAHNLLRAPYQTTLDAFVFTGSSIEEHVPLWLIHKLDTAVSGVVLASCNHKVAEAVKQQINMRNLNERYSALAFSSASRNPPVKHSIRWTDNVTFRRSNGALRMTQPFTVKYSVAETTAVIQRYHTQTCGRPESPSYSIVELDLQPATGYVHQLRYQSATRRLPIIGDTVYGNFAANKHFKSSFSQHPLNYCSEACLEDCCQDEQRLPDLSQIKAENEGKAPYRNYFNRLFLHAREVSLIYTLDGVDYEFSAEAPVPSIFRAVMGASAQ
jgi:23S rRNA-/tRNA-specific pseudouridylate synthase